MTNTPETDAAYKNHAWDMHDNIPLDFARKLERERDEAIRSCHIWQKGHAELVAERDKYWEQADYFLEQLGHTQMRMYDAERKLEKITEALEYVLGIGLTEKTKVKAEKAVRWGHNKKEFTSPYINQ